MRAKGLLSVVMTGAMMASVLSGCGFKPDITWTDTANGSASAYKVTVVVAHDGKLSIDSEQTVKDGDTLNFIATPSKDGDHRITGLMVDGVKRTDYTGELPLEGEVKISLENINQDMTVVVLCDNETGGLGGVDGVVTGLDGTGGGAGGAGGGGSSTVTNPDDENGQDGGATTASLRFEVETEYGTVTAKNSENSAESVTVSAGETLNQDYTVETDENIDLTVTPLYGYEVQSVKDGDEKITGTINEQTGVFTASLNVEDYLNDAAKDLDLNVDYAKKDFTVSTTQATGGEIEVNGQSSASVEYQDNAIITVKPYQYYEITSITVTVDKDGNTTTLTKDDFTEKTNGYYTCNIQVEGDVAVTATYQRYQMEIMWDGESVSGSTWYAGDTIDLNNLTNLRVEVIDSQKNVVKTITPNFLNQRNWSITPDTFDTVGKQSVTIKYEDQNGSCSKTISDVNVKAMEPWQATAWENLFLDIVEDNYKDDKDVGFADENIETKIIDNDGTEDASGIIRGEIEVPESVVTGHTHYYYIKKTVTITNEKEAYKEFISFKQVIAEVMETAEKGLTYDSYGYACITIDPDTGACTMCMAYNPEYHIW